MFVVKHRDGWFVRGRAINQDELWEATKAVLPTEVQKFKDEAAAKKFIKSLIYPNMYVVAPA